MTITTTDLVALPHVPLELIALVEAGETVPPYRNIWLKACNGELPMVIFERGRWKCPRPELPALAQALGLRLKRRAATKPAAKPNLAAEPKPAAKPRARSAA